MPEGWGELRSYGGFDRVRPRLWTEPADEQELAEQLQLFAKQGRKVTFRGGGWSFHDQSLNDDVVVSMARFDSIEVDTEVEPPVVRVGAGARWRDILRVCLDAKVVPGVVVTGGDTTAGGTASGDSVSRFSPAWGKESAFIDAVRIISPDGQVSEHRNPRIDRPDDEEFEVFHAIVGGFGFLGAIVELTYVVLPLGDLAPEGTKEHPKVETRIVPFKDLDALFRRYLKAADAASETRRARRKEVLSQPVDDRPCSQWVRPGELGRWVPGEHQPAPNHPAAEAMYAVIFGARRALLYESWMVPGTRKTKKYLLYRPRFFLSILGHLAIATRVGTRIVNFLAFLLTQLGQTRHVDALDDFTFFMDGNVAAQRWATRMGFELRVVQQTFVVPVPPPTDDAGAPRAPEERLEHPLAFVREALERSREARVTPSMFDILYIPEDESWLSSTDDLDGFAITLAFQHITWDDDRAREWQQRVTALMEQLSELCAEQKGRVHLVKNVHCRRETLRAMYGNRIDRFHRTKDQWDRDGVIGNSFFDRVLKP